MTTAPLPEPRRQEEAAGVVGGLFERHGRMVYGITRAMLRDSHEAEDATQQVFLSAYRALLGGADVREHGRWLSTIARNECRARITAGMRRPLPTADVDLDRLPTSGDERARRDQVEELRAALSELPERQRQAVILRYLYGLRYAEVATALGLSRPATEALLFRARRSMRGRLRPVVGAALVVPSAIREELASALPGFGGAGSIAVGATGGLLAKLSAGPVGMKAATAVVAVSTVGAVSTVSPERVDRREAVPAQRGALDTARAPDLDARGATVRSDPGDDDAVRRASEGSREDGTSEAPETGTGREDGLESSDGGQSGSSDQGSRSGTGGGDEVTAPPAGDTTTPEIDATGSESSGSGTSGGSGSSEDGGSSSGSGASSGPSGGDSSGGGASSSGPSESVGDLSGGESESSSGSGSGHDGSGGEEPSN